MSRIDVTEKIITTKVSKGLKWSEVAAKVGHPRHLHASRLSVCDLGEHIGMHSKLGEEVFEVPQRLCHG